MHQACENILFAEEPFGEMRAAGPGVRKLESHGTLQETVGALRQPDLGHSSTPKQFKQLVRSAKGILGKFLPRFQNGFNLAADQRAPRIVWLIAREQCFHFAANLWSSRVAFKITCTLFLVQIRESMEQTFQFRTKIHGTHSKDKLVFQASSW